MNNSMLFKKAHKMTKLTIKPTEKYRYKFGQWLIFLKTAMTNQLGITNINQSVAYVPILDHDKASYSLSLPLTLNKTTQGEYGVYSDHFYIAKMIGNYAKNNSFLLCLLAVQLIFIVLILNHNFIA